MDKYDANEIITSLGEWIYGADETESDQQLLKDAVRLIEQLQQQVDAVKECQVYVVELDDCEIRWIKESDVLAALKIRTKQ